MPRMYADAEALTTAGVDLPDEQTELRWLAKASRLVEKATLRDYYEVTAAGMPADPEVIETFRDAVIAQAVAWKAARIDPIGGVLAQDDVVSSQSADGASVSYAVLRTPEAIAAAVDSLCSDAVDILKLAGLADGAVTIW
ncbi:head-to-tail adaptor [Gordonia phage ObLaDi]|uniref:Head-to-tail adaptor n=3 Tax=Cafassovirus TaxID=3425056 RepID=A0A9E7QC40_9CAUD|nr:head-to-tail adaptor [Gordonia phage Cafasso]UVK59749.1 head-to-tail adaptor [Gordonia phage Aleemily]UXE03732.1 head-to-tail adaptor [Gordonia phage ObLaDi]